MGDAPDPNPCSWLVKHHTFGDRPLLQKELLKLKSEETANGKFLIFVILYFDAAYRRVK